MGMLEESLPKIVGKALKEEDKTTRDLVKVLLNVVYSSQEKSNPKTVVQKTLDDEIEKRISAGLIRIDDLEEE